MNKIIAIISVFLLLSFNQVFDKPNDSTNSDSSLTGRIKGDDSLGLFKFFISNFFDNNIFMHLNEKIIFLTGGSTINSNKYD